MKMKYFVLIVMIHVCASVIAFGKECPDNTRIDQLPVGKTFLTVVDDEGLTPENSIYYCYSGRCKTKVPLQFKDVFSLGRYFHVGIWDEFVTSLKGETYVFRGLIKDDWMKSGNVLDYRISFVNVKYQDKAFEGSGRNAEIRMYQTRSSLDYRDSSFTYGSMKYNLGRGFKLTAMCE